MRKILIDEKIFIRDDLKRHVGKKNKNYNELPGGFGFWKHKRLNKINFGFRNRV